MLYHKYIFSIVLFFLYNALPSENNIYPIDFDFYRNYLNESFNNMSLTEVDNTTRYYHLYPLIDYLFSIEFFILVERIHTSFYLLIDIIIYLIYSAFEFELKLSYQNLLFLTIGLTFFVIFFSFLVTYLIELNVRKVIKGYLKKDDPRISNNKRTFSNFSVMSMNSLQTTNVY